MSCVGIVPARGGSKRVPNKNIKPLGGKPLLCWTIQAVLNSGICDKVFVNTDSSKIGGIVERHFKRSEVQVFYRKERFGTDTATALDTILDMMEQINSYKVIGYFLPTQPFISSEDIYKCFSRVSDGYENSCVTVVRYSEAPQLSMLKHDDKYLPVFDNLSTGRTNSRFYTPYYKPAGGYVANWNWLREKRNFFESSVAGIEVPKNRAFDIDTEFDFKVAEKMISEGLIGD